MKLAENGIIPTKEWYHDPTLTDKFGNTVAIYLAFKGIIPPQEWHHDTNL